MSRLIDQPVQVTSCPSALARTPEPASFTWRDSRYRVVEILDTWEETGRWWEQEPPATAWRVRVQQGGVMELLHRHGQPAEWKLVRIWA